MILSADYEAEREDGKKKKVTIDIYYSFVGKIGMSASVIKSLEKQRPA